ncbi:MAG TPA: GAF domain-containing protein [Ktedonobacterales bacterium]|nr:GAF domain-containing protein [Ktedonobacterales bacterium]
MAATGESHTMTEEPRSRTRQRRSTSPGARGEGAAQVAPDETAMPPARRSRTTLPPIPTVDTPASVAAPPASDPVTTSTLAQRTSPLRRKPVQRGRPRESSIVGLAERARLVPDQRSLLPLPDPLVSVLPAMRAALLNVALDDALRAVAEALAGALSPAVVQIWIADPIPWTSEQGRVGGLELFPTLRLRALAHAGTNTLTDNGLDAHSSDTTSRLSARPDALIEEVMTTRNATVLVAADDHPLAADWVLRLPPAPDAAPVAPRLGTLAAYPLRARGQFLGVFAVGTGQRLAVRHLAVLAELADLAALAADRDRLLSYSRSQEALAQTVVRHAPVAVAVLTGHDHVFALTNPAFNLLLGLESEIQLSGCRLQDAIPGRAQSFIASLRLDAVYAGGEPQAMLELPIHLDRGMTYWNVTSSPLPGVSTGVGGVLVAAVDVTRQVLARQRAQEAAEVAQERIGQMMTLHATSLAVASQLGADPRELLDDILMRSISLLEAHAGTVYVRDPRRDDLEVIVCQGLRGDYIGSRIRVGEGLAGRVALTGQGLLVDDYRAHPFRAAIYDDEDFSAVIAVPLIQRGQVIGVLDVLDDAERRVFTEDDLWLLDLFAAQAAQAIENARTYVELDHAYRKQRELDRMKDDFIATASHELRTPLTGVQGFLDLLLEYPGSRDEPLALDFLTKAVDSAQELAEISERVLHTSRLDTGRIELHLGPVRLATVVEETLRSFRELRQAQGGGHELLAEVPPELYVQADLGRLKEVLDNLVGNAIKYSPRGGQVLVRCALAAFDEIERAHISGSLGARPIEDRPTMVLPHVTDQTPDPENNPLAPLPHVVAAAAQQPFLVITVSDEGMGIPANEAGQLFGRFARMESARTSQIRGTGLGLYICRQMVRAMGGDVWLERSEPGHGSIFAVALAAAPGERASTETVARVGKAWKS